MDQIEQLDVISEAPTRVTTTFNGEEVEVPALKSRHMARALKLFKPYEDRLLAGDIHFIYKDIDVLMQFLEVVFEKDAGWSGDLEVDDMLIAFGKISEKNPNFFARLVTLQALQHAPNQ